VSSITFENDGKQNDTSLRAHEVNEVEGMGMASAMAPMDPRIGVDSY
jgi:hypothetical protein